MGSNTVLNQVIVLFIIMLIGFYTKKRNILNEAVNKKLSELLLKVTSPLLVISSFQISFTQEILNSVIVVFLFAMSAHIISILLGHVLFGRFSDERKKVMQFAAVYTNCAFMGFPLLESLFGRIGILFGSVYVAAFNIFLWTNGVILFDTSKKLDAKTLKKALLNPGILSVIIGILLFLFSITLPAPIAKAVESVGSMTAPLSMLIIGVNLASCDFKKLLRGLDLYYITAVRLLVIPLLSYLVLKLFGISDMLLTICVLLVAMPIAATTAIFAEMYEGDALFASRAVAFSTLLSILTIPLIMLLR